MLPSSPSSVSPTPMKTTVIMSPNETGISHDSVPQHSVRTSNISSSTTGIIHLTADTTIRNPNRRSNKPIMEKRRRARINNCLNELKSILLEAMRKDPARHSKLEKADILELTVSHLKSLHQSTSTNLSVDSSLRFREGFSECIAEVGRFLSSFNLDGTNVQITGQLLSHLSDCLGTSSCNNMLTNPKNHASNGESKSSFNSSIISLVPSRLPSGEFAFVVPGFNSTSYQIMPLSGSSTNQIQHHPAIRMSPSSMISASKHQQRPMLSPEVPLELTISPSSASAQWSSPNSASTSNHSTPGSSLSSSILSLSPAYPISSASHNHRSHHYRYHPHSHAQAAPYSHSSSSHQTPRAAHFHRSHRLMKSDPDGRPLSLVTTPKRPEEPDMSCWRPW